MEKISVIIVSWNVAESLQRCLDSVFATGYKNLEVIVIDNASTDTSVSVVKNYHLTLVQNQKNIGFPRAVNQGLKRSTGKFILLLNPDTQIPPNFFTQAKRFIAFHPDTGLMGPRFINPDGTTQGSVFPEITISSVFKEFWLNHAGINDKYSPDKVGGVHSISGACIFFPRSTLNKVGYLTESVFMYFEDRDYCRRVHAAGLKVYFNPNITIVHEHGSSSKQTPESNPELLPFWKGYLWKSGNWYYGPLKNLLMGIISWTGQKWHSIFP